MPPGTALLAPRRPAFTTVTEIRATDLRFTLNEARTLFAAAGVELAGPVLPRLVDRTEGWAAGLRLAALSLAERPDPESLADEFSGSERTVAQYLLAEALDRRPEAVRRLLLRTPSGEHRGRQPRIPCAACVGPRGRPRSVRGAPGRAARHHPFDLPGGLPVGGTGHCRNAGQELVVDGACTFDGPPRDRELKAFDFEVLGSVPGLSEDEFRDAATAARRHAFRATGMRGELPGTIVAKLY